MHQRREHAEERASVGDTGAVALQERADALPRQAGVLAASSGGHAVDEQLHEALRTRAQAAEAAVVELRIGLRVARLEQGRAAPRHARSDVELQPRSRPGRQGDEEHRSRKMPADDHRTEMVVARPAEEVVLDRVPLGVRREEVDVALAREAGLGALPHRARRRRLGEGAQQRDPHRLAPLARP
jgi:hypothetical protein